MLLLLAFSHTAFPQLNHSIEVETTVMGGNLNELPFWMYSNSKGRLSRNTFFTGRFSAVVEQEFYNGSNLEVEAGILYRNGTAKDLIADEAYLHYENSLLKVTAGIKHQPTIYSGLSATNSNFYWSQNAGALPGIRFGTSAPFYFMDNQRLGVEMEWGDYILSGDPAQDNVKLHHKSLHFILNLEEGWLMKGGLRHYVQWGGILRKEEQESELLNDYFRAISGRQGMNSYNNHVGSWEAKVAKENSEYYFELYADLPFESGKGAKLGNFPDGRFGAYWEHSSKDRLVNALLYEFITTKNGDHPDYFNHAKYQAGWTYRQQVLGVPFITYDHEKDRISNNLFSAHHIGIAGETGTYYEPHPYRLLLSFSQNHGTPTYPIEKKTSFSGFFDIRLYNGPFLLNLQLASDFTTSAPPNYAAGTSLLYNF